MKKILLATIISMMTFSSFAAGTQELNLTIPDDVLHEPKQEVKVVEKYDANGVFYDVELQTLLFIPGNITVGAGITSSSKEFEAEVFAGVDAIRVIGNGDVHIPYGARVRVALNENKTIYAEYTYQGVYTDLGRQDGIFENPNTLSIVKLSKDRKSYMACGIGQTIHHAWSNEDHAPEKSLAPFCRFGIRL